MAGDLRQRLSQGLEGDARRARLALIDHLVADGCTEAELHEAHAAGRLSLLPLERVLRIEGNETLEEVAAAHGVPVPDLVRTRRALGLPVVPGEPVYGEPLARHASRLRAAIDAGVPVDALVAVNRVIGRGMAAIAAAGRDVVTASITGATGADEDAQGMEVASAVETLIPLMKDVLLYAYEEHARELVRNEQAGAVSMAMGGADLRDVGVGFADLVGYTALGGELSASELSEVASRLESLAGDALRPGVTIVKTIGDEVMLAAEDAAGLAATMLDLVAAADAEPGSFPRLRAGAAYGAAARRSGDWYGAPVNLASRLTSLADPGSLLADDAFARAAGDRARWQPAGDREVRGVTGGVATFSAAPV